MALQLRRNLACCLSGGKTVFLDLEADRYFCLSREADEAFQGLVSGQGATSDAGLRTLVERGLLVEADGEPIRMASIAPPLQDPGALPRPRILDITGAVAAQLRAARGLRRVRLLDLLKTMSDAGRWQGPPSRQAEIEARRVAAAFAAAAMILGSHDRCLSRSLALVSLCNRRGAYPRLVFGVTADPFAAHAWVQLGDMVLTGDLEQARQFTPILALP